MLSSLPCLVCLGKCQQFNKDAAPVCGDGGGEVGQGGQWGRFLRSEFGVACRGQSMEGLAFHTKELGGFIY